MSFTVKIGCKIHPRYNGKKQPRGGCVDCARALKMLADRWSALRHFTRP